MAKTERCIEEVYNKFAYPSHQKRIDAAKKYLAQQENRKLVLYYAQK